MTQSAPIPATRSLETTIDIAAPADSVWKALTDANELTNWFPLEAHVTPGVGGAIRQSWRGHWQGEERIEIWEPNRHLRTSMPGPFPGGDPAAVPVAIDYHLEANGPATRLRLVHSGFSNDPKLDDLYDGTRRGWAFELRGLRHYLQRHPGTKRHVAWAKAEGDISVAEAWKHVTSPLGLLKHGTLQGMSEGDHYAITTAPGDRLEGAVQILDIPHAFAAVVANKSDALLRLRVDRYAFMGGKTEINLWLSSYGRPEEEVQAFEQRNQDLLDVVVE